MLCNIEIFCFSTGYLIAFGLELIRSRRQINIDNFFALFLVAVISNSFVHFACLISHFLFQNMRIVSGMQGWFLLLAWGLSLFYIYCLIFHFNKQFGLFILPFVLFLIAGSFGVGETFFSEKTTFQFIRGLHGISLLITTLLVLIGFVTGGMYFMQKSRLKRKSSLPGNSIFPNVNLPTLEWLQIANRRSIKLSVIFLGIGVLSGFDLNFRMINAGSNHGNPFGDAMIVGTTFLFGIMILLLSILSWTNRLNDGKKIALLTIFCFLFLLIILLIGTLNQAPHWKKTQELVQQQKRSAAQSFIK